MLHHVAIVHVRTCFKQTLSTRVMTYKLPDEWLLALYNEAPRWVGPALAKALRNAISRSMKPDDIAGRISRVYSSMLKHYYGRAPAPEAMVRDVTRMIHSAVTTLCTPSGNRPEDRRCVDTAYRLIGAFGKICHSDTCTPTGYVWRFLSAATLPLTNQSSRRSRHVETWFDALVRYAVIDAADKGEWTEVHRIRKVHPATARIIVEQVTDAESHGLISEAASDAARVELEMGARPEGAMLHESDCMGIELADFDNVRVTPLIESAIPPDLGSGFAGFEPLELPSPHSKVSLIDALVSKSAMSRKIDEIVGSPTPLLPIVSATDFRPNWRRTDGTLYCYFRVTANSKLTRVADHIAFPPSKRMKPTPPFEGSLECDEPPLADHE